MEPIIYGNCGGKMMNNLVALPVILPLGTGVLLLLLHGRLQLQRWISFFSALSGLGIAAYLTHLVWTGGIIAVQGGGWAAPYGITLAADLLSGLMLLLTSISLLTVLIYAPRHLDGGRERTFFYPVLNFLTMGIALSFVTGDMFNLFVAFEVMLISSYFLMVLGGAPGQLREGFKYLVINATASTLFLVAVSLLYSVTASLNMADIAVKAAALPGNPIITLTGIAFLIVFGVKGALFPLYFWLPRSYFEAPTAISAIFAAILTKVGIYALIRIFTLIFIHDVAFTHNLLLILAGFGMVLGVMGAISQYDFKAILAYHSISQMGYIVMGLGLLSRLSLAGAVLFLAHHSVVKSGLFLLAGIVERLTGSTDLKKYSGMLASHPGLAFTFLGMGLSLAGLPPFSGFFGKFALVKAAVEQGAWVILTVSLVVSIFTLFSMVKIYRKGFWGEGSGERRVLGTWEYGQLLFPALLLLGLSIGMGFGAGYFMDFALAAADQLLAPELYIKAVLGR
jgi:multicomponent Na+:H+ antiporter subunit D